MGEVWERWSLTIFEDGGGLRKEVCGGLGSRGVMWCGVVWLVRSLGIDVRNPAEGMCIGDCSFRMVEFLKIERCRCEH